MQVKTVPLAKLELDPDNSRDHPDKNMKAVIDSLKTFGQVEPLVVQERNGVVLGGNARLLAMRQLGWSKAKVTYVDLSDEKARALAIALNRTAELAEWNEAKLSEILSTITEDSLLEATGFDDSDMRALMAASSMDDFAKPEVDGEALPEAAPTTAPGPSGDGFWFYVEYYGDEAKFEELKAKLDKVLVNKHEVQPDAFAKMVDLYANQEAWT